MDAVEGSLRLRTSMTGLRVLIGAGRTEEPLDPVRVLTNRSSGRMGFALAEAARDRGAEVTVVAGPVSVDPPAGVDIVGVTTALQMERAMRERGPKANVIIMAAAVADYRPAQAVAAEDQARRGRSRREARAQPRHPRGPGCCEEEGPAHCRVRTGDRQRARERAKEAQ